MNPASGQRERSRFPPGINHLRDDGTFAGARRGVTKSYMPGPRTLPPSSTYLTPSMTQHLPQNVLQDTPVSVVLGFLRRVDAHPRLETHRLAPAVRRCFNPNGLGRAVP